MTWISCKTKKITSYNYYGILIKTAALYAISSYQRFISPSLPPSCRYNPTCSQYAKEAITRYGVAKGFLMALKRLLRCHPFARGGDDFLR